MKSNVDNNSAWPFLTTTVSSKCADFLRSAVCTAQPFLAKYTFLDPALIIGSIQSVIPSVSLVPQPLRP